MAKPIGFRNDSDSVSALRWFEWMLSGKSLSGTEARPETHDQGYGDLTELNRDGMIRTSIGRERRQSFANDYSAGFVWTLACLAISFALSGSAIAWGTPTTPLRSACEVGYPPFSVVHEDGRADGFSVELMRAALTRMGRDVTFRTGPWDEVKGWLERGEVDALPLVGRTPEREEFFDFTVSYMTMHGAIVVRKDTEDVHALADLHGRRVGVMKGDNAEEFLRRVDRGFAIVSMPTFTDAFQALDQGRCDAVVVQRLVAIRLLQETGLDRLRIVERPVHDFSQAFCFAVKKGDSETLALLNEGLALAVADGTHRRLHAKWFAALELPPDRPIVMGGDHNYPPFEFLDKNGRPAGHNVDLTRAVAEATGLDIRIRLGEWTAIKQALESGEIDAVMGMFYSLEGDKRFDFSQAHLVNHGVAVTRKTDAPPPSSVEELAGKRIILQAGDIMHAFCRQNGLTNHLKLVDSQEAALRELAEGRHDVALVARMAAFYWIEQEGWDNLSVGQKALASPEYCFAVPHGSQALLAQLSEGLTAISHSGEYRRIHEKWMGVYGDHFMWGDILKYVAMIAGPLLLIAILALLWSWALRRQVSRRTAELQEKEAFIRRVIDNLPVGVAVNSLEPAVAHYMNDLFPKIYRTTRDKIADSDQFWKAVYPDPEFRAKIQAQVEADCRSGDSERMVWTDIPIERPGEPTTYVTAQNKLIPGTSLMISSVSDITEQRRQEESLRRIEWMLTPGHATPLQQTPPAYGDLTGLNTERTILDAVGKDTLEDIVRDYLDLLDTSAAVYERNGDYACGIFASGWCRLMDDASRRLCGTANNTAALVGGKWNCHESCWNEASKVAMDTGKPTDIECAGGIRLYAVPIEAGGRIVGAMNFGYGDPPRDPEMLRELARKYGLDPADLLREAGAYESRPPYIIEMAKRRIEASARLIGEMVERARAEARIEHLNGVLRSIRDVNQLIVREKDQGQLIHTACEILVRDSSYTAALILLTDGQGHLTEYIQAGMDAVFAPLAVWLDDGRMPPCCKAADGVEGGVYVVSDPQAVCSPCPIAEHCPGSNVMCTHLAHGNETFGFLAVAADPAQAIDEDETGLIREMAEDLGYALHTMAVHRARQEAETARDTAQKALLQAQKLESVGRLAGGVAHDFNNLIMGIMGYAELCRERIGVDHPIREWLDEIVHEAERSASLTRQLLAFARKQTIAPKVLDLNDAVGNMLKMLRRLIGEDIDLVWEPGAGLWPVKIDPGQLDQILANLCVNARDAIAGVGKLTIETENASIDEAYCEGHVYVMLAVSDDGCGMDRETLANIFEPFYTTKGVGEGTGLGLATVYGIVKQNEGFVKAYSEPGQGTTFRIYLPRVAAAATEQARARPTDSRLGGRETILLVEDEKSVRVTLSLFLKDSGYTVLAADSPEAALRLASEYGDAVDLLLTDVVMPGMSGRELAEKLAPNHPEMKVLYMSGYTANVIAHRGILDVGVHFVGKPVSRDILAAKVREVLSTGNVRRRKN